MAQFTERKALLAAIETTYGTDAVPTAGSNAILVADNLTCTPLDGTDVSRNLVRPYTGTEPTALVGKITKLEFEVEYQSSGAAGTVPAWGILHRACGFSETIAAAASNGILTATVASGGAGYAVGDYVTLAGGTLAPGGAAARLKVTGVTAGAITTTSIDWAGAYTTAPTTPASQGTTTGGGSGATFTITSGAVPAQVRYGMISTGFESASIYFNQDGVLHKLIGARGSVSLQFDNQNIPHWKYSFWGLYSTPTAVALPGSINYSRFVSPLPATLVNTPTFTLSATPLILQSLMIDRANKVSPRMMVGSEYIQIVDRQPVGQLSVEAPTLATRNFFNDAANSTLGALQLIHGITAGAIMQLDLPQVQVGRPAYADVQGIQHLTLPLRVTPLTGDDEILITCK